MLLTVTSLCFTNLSSPLKMKGIVRYTLLTMTLSKYCSGHYKIGVIVIKPETYQPSVLTVGAQNRLQVSIYIQIHLNKLIMYTLPLPRYFQLVSNRIYHQRGITLIFQMLQPISLLNRNEPRGSDSRLFILT